ncbi:hypothetical protein SPBR_04979 [Sporothrix brasiliensis 5110]|uniref:Uncharacterized protein n=1 Tax=Sporothrix brasiliensis 5110 TaxID=1398154 RepID=A0A0C2IJF6_9PEZI|nr:uncharacterized protein SPBR_04979 [Sporothrix brasiliensis 5110]KIH87085.1 hypothetical protein SPBR_04979 [Sporothrix brasiliensis 5110]
MLSKLKAHLFSGGSGRGTTTDSTASSGSSASPQSVKQPARPRYIPNLYPVGDTTIETYFRRLLTGAVDKSADSGLADRVHEDVVAAAIHVASAGGYVLPEATKFLPTLTRCITADYDTVRFADEYMAEPEEAGVSALATPLLLQILVAVALKHRHKDMLQDLLEKHGRCRPEMTLFATVGPGAFRGAPRGDGVLDDPHYGPAAWALLANAGWAPSLRTDHAVHALPVGLSSPDSEEARHAIAAAAVQSYTDPGGALAALDDWLARGLDPQPLTGWILDALVKDGTPAMVAHFLGVVSRKVYDGIPPRPKWPGMQSLVTMAAARPPASRAGESITSVSHTIEPATVGKETRDNPGYGVLRVLVDIGGMDIHTSPGTWYKSGPDDEHPMALSRSTQLPDGSCADDPPLLAAVHAGNTSSVVFMLERGVAERRAGVLDEAIGRAKAQQNIEMEELLEKWKKESK